MGIEIGSRGRFGVKIGWVVRDCDIEKLGLEKGWGSEILRVEGSWGRDMLG